MLETSILMMMMMKMMKRGTKRWNVTREKMMIQRRNMWLWKRYRLRVNRGQKRIILTIIATA
ncbi:hypothetical protein D3C80_1763910 [compost metagenome]